MEIEARAHALEQERMERAREKQQMRKMPQRRDASSKAEFEARMWAFMYASPVLTSSSFILIILGRFCRSYKPSDSDDEDDSGMDDDDDPEDPANWFIDDQDDGRKGQNIIYPDAEEFFSDIIRVDDSRLSEGFSAVSYYEMDDEGE